jgi:hypothetical protein
MRPSAALTVEGSNAYNTEIHRRPTSPRGCHVMRWRGPFRNLGATPALRPVVGAHNMTRIRIPPPKLHRKVEVLRRDKVSAIFSTLVFATRVPN